RELELRREQLALATTFAVEDVANHFLAVVLGEFRFPVEGVQMAGATLHEHEDHALGLGSEVRSSCRRRIHRGARCLLGAEAGESHPSETGGGVLQELPT